MKKKNERTTHEGKYLSSFNSLMSMFPVDSVCQLGIKTNEY